MNDALPPRRRVTRALRLLVIMLVLVLAVLAVRAVFDVWMGRRFTDEVARLEQQFGPLQWDPVRKLDAWKTWPRRIAPENRARVLDAAAARVTLTDATHTFIYLPRTALSLTSDQARSVADENRDAIGLAIRASRLQHSNWEITYIGEVGNVPNVMDLDNLSKVLAIAARSDTDAGRPDDAAADLTAGFALAAAMRSEPVAVMEINGWGVAREQVEVLKDTLSRSDPSPQALAALAATIDENHADPPARATLLGELKHVRATWPWVAQGYLWGRRTVDYAVPSRPTAWMRAAGWFARPVIRFVAVRDLAERARAVDAASLPRSRRASSGASSSAIGRINSLDAVTAMTNLAATAVALRRFHLDHGAYPNALDDLVPSYLKTVPLDPFTERGLEYGREGAGFTLRAAVPVPPLRPGSFLRGQMVDRQPTKAEWEAAHRGQWEWKMDR